MARSTPRFIGLALLASLALAGCGRVSATGVPVLTPSTAPRQVTTADPMDVMPTTPIGTTITGVTPGVQPQPGGLRGACEALAGCDVHAQLVVGDVQKKKSGFLWRKLKVTGKVTNRGAGALDGEVMIRFLKKGKVVQSEYVAIAALASSQSKPFEHTSSVAADDVEVTSRVL